MATKALQSGTEFALMKIPLEQAPFLVGVKGRNIALIRKCTGMLITIRGDTVHMSKQRSAGYKPDLAVRMILSACAGGILRWFVTQKATAEGYPFEKIYTYELVAQKHACELRLLRARCGHMCLMLLPLLPSTADPLPTPSDMDLFRSRIAAARVDMLEALAPPIALKS
jgi:hypothetical protein